MTILTRRANLEPQTVDPETRTARLIWSTGADVARRDFEGEFVERLSLDPAHVDLRRLDGANLLDGHEHISARAILGVLSDPRTDGREGTATVRFSRRPDVQPIFEDVQAGIIRAVSVGYQVERWQDSKENGRRVRTAVSWTPIEVSLVGAPADAGARIRSSQMPDTTTAPAPASTPAPTIDQRAAPTTTAPTPETQAPPAESRATVNAQIRSMARTAGLDQAWIDSQIDAGTGLDQARAAAFEAMQRRSPPLRTEQSHVQVLRDHNDPTAMRAAMSEAIAARWAPGSQPGERAREFASWPVTDMLAELANARGAGLDARDRRAVADAMFGRSVPGHTTSDFPLLLADATNKMMLPAYAAAAPTFRRWAGQRTFSDFKPHKFLRTGDFPALQEIGEHGETNYGTMGERQEDVTAKEYGSGIAIGRKALINDDLSVLQEFSRIAAVRVAHDENSLVYGIILANGPTLRDGTALFATSRGNKAASGTDIDGNLGAAVTAMRKMSSIDGLVLNVAPRFLVVGPDREIEARKLLAAITPTRSTDVNIFSGSLELVIDANITTNRWYLFADPGLYPTIVYGYLTGNMGPTVRSEIDFDTRALKVAVDLDFGAGAVDHVGAYLNEGN